MLTTLDGKVVLITGGSAGICKAAATLFVEAGASVAIAARGAARGQRVEQELLHAGLNVRFLRAGLQGDVCQSEQVQSLMARTKEFGRLDYALDNAAVLGKIARTADFSDADSMPR
jgi:NAD(P)-dependent dehydrogenase (short-subunit alcohol dehydrogenase family)